MINKNVKINSLRYWKNKIVFVLISALFVALIFVPVWYETVWYRETNANPEGFEVVREALSLYDFTGAGEQWSVAIAEINSEAGLTIGIILIGVLLSIIGMITEKSRFFFGAAIVFFIAFIYFYYGASNDLHHYYLTAHLLSPYDNLVPDAHDFAYSNWAYFYTILLSVVQMITSLIYHWVY